MHKGGYYGTNYSRSSADIRLFGVSEGKRKSAATVEKYVRDVCVFYAFVGDREIDKQAVLDYKAYLGNHYAVASANSMIAALNALLRYCGAGELAVKRFAVQRNIFCEEQKELTREEYFRLIAAANKRRNERLSLIIQTICGICLRARFTAWKRTSPSWLISWGTPASPIRAVVGASPYECLRWDFASRAVLSVFFFSFCILP